MVRQTSPPDIRKTAETPVQSPAALDLVDRWLHDRAIRRAALLAFLAGLATLVLVAVLGGPSLLGTLAGPALYPLLGRRRRPR
jgi:hypothetical protein